MRLQLTSLRAALRDLRASIRWKVQDLGGYYGARLNRARLPAVTFIGITGSAGKTTTKDLTAAILATLARCNSSPETGNLHYVYVK